VTDFDLRTAVIEVLDTTSLTEPAAIAGKVAENVPSRQLRAVLTEALVTYVAVVNQQRRMNNGILGGARRPARSAKVAAIGDWHAKALRDRVHVDGHHKLLGDCTYEDLMFAAGERRKLAHQNATKADQYQALAEKLREHDVKRVANLPLSAWDDWGTAA
jgi:hypothetical protein